MHISEKTKGKITAHETLLKQNYRRKCTEVSKGLILENLKTYFPS